MRVLTMALNVVSSLRMQATRGILGQLAGGNQSLVEGLDDGVTAAGGECGHVQHAADVEGPALDVSLALAGAGVACHRGDAHQGGDLAPVEPPERGQFGDQRGAGHGTDAAGRLQQSVEVAEVLAHVADHLGLDVVELCLDGCHDGFDARV